jgi:predicted dehydrogenase
MTVIASASPVRIGIVGVGQFGQLHASTVTCLAESQLVAIVDNNRDQLDNVAKQRPDVSHWSDLHEAIGKSKAEAWIIASSTSSHVQIAHDIMSAGYPVLIEKPIAGSLSEARTLKPLVKPDSSNLMLGHVLLFNSEFRQLQEEVNHRGRIKYIDCVRHRPTTTLTNYPGESPFHLTMVHDLYSVLVLMDRAEPVSMNAQIHKTSNGECDLALAQLQWEDGTIASFTASFMTPSGMASDGFDRMEVFGKGWASRIYANPRPIEVWDDRAHWPMALEIRKEENSATGMLAEEIRCFCRVVRGIQQVPVGATYENALQVQNWIEQIESITK